ncbi:MAG: aldehyde ferredoxin oxidoreductase [Candidatus Lokiarchaeota archaeon]|nr:aldehyde ferredoxin oxidoreductase [Candidatus Lokiarchaeota archaeon]
MSDNHNVLPLTGMSGFLASALNYVKNTSKIKNQLKKKNLNIKVALIAPDLPNGALLNFKDHKVELEPIGEADWENPNKWEVKIEGPAKVFFDYFMGRLGAVRPILFRKLTTTPYPMGALKLLKILWFIKVCIQVYSNNTSQSEAMFYKFYNHGTKIRVDEKETGKKGYQGKILWVNLSKNKITEEIPEPNVYRNYLGGYGLGAYYIYNRIKPKCDPLGPDNILGFCPGLLTGTMAPFTGRYMVCGKSPLTGGWGDANSGGKFGPAIKKAGYDAIFVTGTSEKPVYLCINENKQELLDASELWGKTTRETQEILQEKHGNCDVASIGPGGEKKSLIAGIVNDSTRLAARSGLGAVMGAKKIKAICVIGKKKIEVSDKSRMIELAKSYTKQINDYKNNLVISYVVGLAPGFAGILRIFKIHYSSFKWVKLYTQFLAQIGTPFFLKLLTNVGDAPVRNYSGVAHKEFSGKRAKKLDGKYLRKYYSGSVGCFACPVRCGAMLTIPELNINNVSRPEFETIAAFGGLLLNDDLKSIIHINEYLDLQGLDTISCGGIVAYVLECVEKGLLKKEDFKCQDYPDGFIPQWNDSKYLLTLCKLIATREGIGDILADGVRKASEKIKFSEECAIHSRGQELPMHDGRLTKGLLLTYVTDPSPGRHTAGGVDYFLVGAGNAFLKGFKLKNSKKDEKKGKIQAEAVKFTQSFNSCGLCLFSEWVGTYPLLEMIKAFAGWDLSVDDFLKIGWRIQTLRQMFNARDGEIKHEITKRAIGDPPLEKGPLKGKKIDVEKMAKAYYATIGFSESGVPTETTLKNLELDFCIKDLPNCTGRPNLIINESIKA